MNKEKLVVASGGRWLMLDVCDIIFVEVMDHQVIIHCRERIVKIRNTLFEIEEQLKDRDFCRIHRSFLVSLSHVCQYGRDYVVMDDMNGTVLPIGCRYRANFERDISGGEALSL